MNPDIHEVLNLNSISAQVVEDKDESDESVVEDDGGADAGDDIDPDDEEITAAPKAFMSNIESGNWKVVAVNAPEVPGSVKVESTSVSIQDSAKALPDALKLNAYDETAEDMQLVHAKQMEASSVKKPEANEWRVVSDETFKPQDIMADIKLLREAGPNDGQVLLETKGTGSLTKAEIRDLQTVSDKELFEEANFDTNLITGHQEFFMSPEEQAKWQVSAVEDAKQSSELIRADPKMFAHMPVPDLMYVPTVVDSAERAIEDEEPGDAFEAFVPSEGMKAASDKLLELELAHKNIHLQSSVEALKSDPYRPTDSDLPAEADKIHHQPFDTSEARLVEDSDGELDDYYMRTDERAAWHVVTRPSMQIDSDLLQTGLNDLRDTDEKIETKRARLARYVAEHPQVENDGFEDSEGEWLSAKHEAAVNFGMPDLDHEPFDDTPLAPDSMPPTMTDTQPAAYWNDDRPIPEPDS
eukprot:c45372_g1_i1.p1 GENE.c45372_g1_i1~~c45372_g1_i1.p1  ORF type:complete len:523 (+),score=123.96 c45372_g1_i1:163-1569(+)